MLGYPTPRRKILDTLLIDTFMKWRNIVSETPDTVLAAETQSTNRAYDVYWTGYYQKHKILSTVVKRWTQILLISITIPDYSGPSPDSSVSIDEFSDFGRFNVFDFFFSYLIIDVCTTVKMFCNIKYEQ